jgi:CRP-like cAMP-binding protein
MPPFFFPLMVSASAIWLLLNPDDYVGEIKGIITASSVYVLYWLSQRSKRRAKEDAQQHQTTEEVFKFSADKEKRLDERESRLRQEEREFAHTQIRLSRKRGHILARGYMAMEMANDRLIELLRTHDIDVPAVLLTQQTRAQVLGELKEVEDEQAAIVEPS